MDNSKKQKYHFRPQKGWINDPNGLVYFQGYYHVFYQHAPDFEVPWKQPMHWGHTRTKDFLNWEELPVALYPDKNYDRNGCWSGTATVKNGVLYLIYASIRTPEGSEEQVQTVSVAYSTDGIHFEKYAHNPVIDRYPAEGGADFRDPAVCCVNGKYYCVMATGNPQDQAARLLLYQSDDLFDWTYLGIMSEWANCKYAECPSFLPEGGKRFLLGVSVCPIEKNHYFSILYGTLENGKFCAEHTAEVDKGPDQYAGQIFRDHRGRAILISWIPGWQYCGYADKDVGCMSIPKQVTCKDGKICAYPVEEVQHLLKEEEPCVKRTDTGFVIERTGRDPVIYKGNITDLKIIRDTYTVEVFVNGGQEVYSVLL